MENMETLTGSQKTELVEQTKLTITSLTAEQLEQAKSIAEGINIDDYNAVVQYGAGVQNEVSKFADTMLERVRTKDAGATGTLVSDLVLKVESVDVSSLANTKKGFLASLPLVGNLFDQFKKVMSQYKSVAEQIEIITAKMDESYMEESKDLVYLQTMFDKNLEFFKKIELYIAAGQMKLQNVNDVELPALRSRFESSQDALLAQEINDKIESQNRFEKKVHNLLITRKMSQNQAPQIRNMQNNKQSLMSNAQDIVYNLIPLWKQQLSIALTAEKSKKNLEVQRTTKDMIEASLKATSEMLKTTTIEIAKEGERGLISLETLQKTNRDLIDTLKATQQISEQGKKDRAIVEVEMVKMENELKQTIVSLIKK